MKKQKNSFTISKALPIYIISIFVAVALLIGNYFANIYESVINVFFGSSSYSISEAEEKLCLEVEEEGIVLLKNEDGALPLKTTEKTVALFGQNSVDFVYGGAGSGSVETKALPTLKDSMEKAGFTVNSTLWDFYTVGAGKNYRKSYPDMSGLGEFEVNEVPANIYGENVKQSFTDSVAIVSFGRGGGESSDLPIGLMDTGYKYLQLDNNELDVLALACEHYSKVIVIINSSNALELGFLNEEKYENVKAAIWVGAVGNSGIYAIGEVLSGSVNPSGRLADTYAYDSQSAPSFINFGNYKYENSNVDHGKYYLLYQEGIYVGYRYYETRYEDVVLDQGNAGDYDYASQVQYPFGYGLSYTQFTWSNFDTELSDDGKTVNVSLTVTNDGEVKGKDVVEIYLQSPYTDYDRANGIEKSAVALVGYYKTGVIEKGESEDVNVSIPVESFASYDDFGYKTYILDSGNYYLSAGKNAHDALNNILAMKGKTVADGMTYNGNADLATVALKLDELDSTTYSVSQVTKNPITNQFEDADINTYEEQPYLSRNDWMGTMPISAFKNGSWTISQSMLDSLEFYRADEVVNDSDAEEPVYGSTATSYTVQDMIGADYNDARWEALIEQLSWGQLTRLVRLGGYSTISIDTIQLPATVDKDGPSGISATLVGGTSCMSWPVEVVFASTWNDELIERVGEMIGQESIDSGVTGWYAPGVNIHRSPYSGRNFEYFSEDGFLSGKIGAAEMRGVRSKGVIAYMKHFALNDQEINRYGGSMFAKEQAIREIFLKGFEYTVREGNAIAVMASMNRIGLRWAGAHKGLVNNVLREEWGFKGVVITDQASVASMTYQDMISGLWAGTDLWLNTNTQLWSLNAYKDNATVMNNAQRAAKNIVYAITNSNAVVDYTTGGASDYSDGMAAWKIALIVLDVIVWTACAIGIVIPTVRLIKANGGSKAEN